jgi:hypothetical protein
MKTVSYDLFEPCVILEFDYRNIYMYMVRNCCNSIYRLELELERDKRERDARERELREHELRSLEMREKLKAEMEMKPPGT